MADRTAPGSLLRLEWVYGYRGHQCRNNLYYNCQDEVVYFVAGVGVVYNLAQHKQRFFLGHDDDIISLAIHPEGKLIATGQVGKAPYICIWDSTTCEVASILKDGHERGVSCLSFNSTGTLLASVGLEDYSQLAVWDWKKGKILATTRGHTDRIFDVHFNPYKDNELVSCGVKHIKFWKLCGNSLTGKKGIFGKTGEIQTILCLAYGQNDILYSGTLSGDIYRWQGNTLIGVVSNAHMGGIFTMHGTSDGYATGSKDGTVALWDTDFKLITRIDLAHNAIGYEGLSIRSVCWKGEKVLAGTTGGEVYEVSATDKEKPAVVVQGHAEGELWGLASHPTKQMFVTASDDKSIRLWNSQSKTLMERAQFDAPARSTAFSPDGGHIAVGFGDGSFRVLKGRDLSELVHIKDRKEVLHEMKFSPDGTLLAVGSNDNFVDIYAVDDQYKRVGQCKGSSSYITHVDFSDDSKYLQTNSGAGERLFYKMPNGKRITNQAEIDAIHWATWTAVLGPEVNGIWEKYTDNTDVNAVDANFSQGVVVTGDDFGLVKLFRFPSIKKGAKYKKYGGHSAHVTNVRFSCDGSYVISTGGADHAIFQWKYIPDGPSKEIPDSGSAVGEHTESLDEGSDSDLSDVNPLDSDIEQEVSAQYERVIYKEDLPRIAQKIKEQEKSSGSRDTRVRKSKQRAPSKGIQLGFVHGYRGYDCRNNLFYTQTGKVVFHVAAVGVVYDKEQHDQRFYLGHDDDILCLTVHPAKDYIATGQVGRDPSIHVWDAEKLEAVSVFKGQHERGVCALDFSADGKKLASVGLDDNHCIVVWDWRKGEKLATTRGHKDKIFEIKWDPLNSDNLVTVGVKHIKFWTQSGGGFTSKRGVFGQQNKPDTMLSCCYGKTPGLVYAGSASGKVLIWENGTLKQTVEAHGGPVFSLSALEKGFVTGGKDGVVGLWDEGFSRCLKSYKISKQNLEKFEGQGTLSEENPPIRAVTLGQGKILVGTKFGEILEVDKNGPINILVQGHSQGEVWGLAWHPRELTCATVGDDGTLRIWDVDKQRMKHIRKLNAPARSLDYSPDGKAIAIGMLNGSFLVVNGFSLEDIIGYHHRKEEISDIKFSPGGKYLAVGSHDNFVDIYNVLTNQRVGICKGGSSYVTHIDWDTSGKLLMVNTGAKELLYFEAPRGRRQVISVSEVDRLEWATWTSVLGKQCDGIWPPGSDITDVNAACATSDRSLIATADDFGFVKIFDFPCKGKHAKCKKYNGHSAHVTNVRWSSDDTKLATVGGADTSLMIWNHLKAEIPAQLPTAAAAATLEDSDTDSEEESGYDSDVDREKKIDYASKAFTSPLREASGTKPQNQAVGSPEKQKLSRGSSHSRATNRKELTTGDGKRKRQDVQDLRLECVHGYRGFDARNNVHYSTSGEVVYHAASLGIVLDTTTQKQLFYFGHDDDILCLTCNRNPKFKNVIATGQVGVTPSIHIWDASTRETISVLQGFHSKGVNCLNFSSSGRYLVSVGLDDQHTIAVWRWIDGACLATSRGSSRRIFVVEFRPDSDTSFVTCGVKHIMFWNVAGATLVGVRGNVDIPSLPDVKMQTMLSVAFGANDTTFTGTLSGDVYVWVGPVLSRIVSQAHSGPVFSMYTTIKDGLIVTGGKEKGGDSGIVKLWDQEMRKCRSYPVSTSAEKSKLTVIRSVCRGTAKGTLLIGTQDAVVLEISEKTGAAQVLCQSHADGEIWGLAMHPEKAQFATASDDGTVRVWNLEPMVMIRCVSVGAPARSVVYSSSGELMAVGMKNGEFLILNANSLKILARKRDRRSAIQDLRIKPVDIYHRKAHLSSVYLSLFKPGASGYHFNTIQACEFTSVLRSQSKFSPDGQTLAVGSDENTLDFYNSKPGGSLPRVGYCKGIPSFVIQMDFSADGKYIQVSTGAYERMVFTVPEGHQETSEEVIDHITWHTWTSIVGKEVIGIWPKDAEKGDVNCADLSKLGSTLATGDDFGYVKLFKFPSPQKFAKGKKYVGHSAHVTNVRFSCDDQYLVSTGGEDCCVLVWKTY